VLLYVTSGAAVLQLKGEGDLHRRAASSGRVAAGILAVLTALCALALPGTMVPLHLSSPGRAWAFGLLAAVAAAALLVTGLSFGRQSDSRPVIAVVTAQVCGLAALAVATFPTLVPPSVTISSAQSPPASTNFMLIGVGLSIPLVLFYNWYAHHVFRGKYRAAAPPRPEGMTLSAHVLGPVSHEEA
jgi:cytochrome d ubiquinol oxidase subunit II